MTMQQNIHERNHGNPEPVLADEALYIGDNGRCACGRHHGISARYTGRDTSGQPVMRVTKADADFAMREYGATLKCEDCGRAA